METYVSAGSHRSRPMDQKAVHRTQGVALAQAATCGGGGLGGGYGGGQVGCEGRGRAGLQPAFGTRRAARQHGAAVGNAGWHSCVASLPSLQSAGRRAGGQHPFLCMACSPGARRPGQRFPSPHRSCRSWGSLRSAAFHGRTGACRRARAGCFSAFLGIRVHAGAGKVQEQKQPLPWQQRIERWAPPWWTSSRPGPAGRCSARPGWHSRPSCRPGLLGMDRNGQKKRCSHWAEG